MLAHKSYNSLSRRGSKLLVEAVIGVVGILGIMLAQIGEAKREQSQALSQEESAVIEVSEFAPQIDWLEILF